MPPSTLPGLSINEDYSVSVVTELPWKCPTLEMEKSLYCEIGDKRSYRAGLHMCVTESEGSVPLNTNQGPLDTATCWPSLVQETHGTRVRVKKLRKCC